MSIQWSRIHARLGEPPSPLTLSHVEAAVAQQMTEDEDLDWKQVLPAKEALDGFAKDVAAMANTRGGLLVYGVEEERGKGTAKKIHAVDTSEAMQQRLRAVAASRIHPPVLGLDFIALASDDGTESVLVLVVPRSPDAPHIIGQQNTLGVPYRDGRDTQWMRERDIERAYNDRFGRRATETQRLAEMSEEIAEHLDLTKGAWLTGVAKPRTPTASIARPLKREDFQAVLEAALKLTVQIVPPRNTYRFMLLRELSSDNVLNPAVGLRRWIARTRSDYGPDGKSSYVHVELHLDGSVGFAFSLHPWQVNTKDNEYMVLCPVVESFMVDFVAIAEAAARHHREQVPAAARFDVVREDPDKPLTAVDYVRFGGHISTSSLENPVGSRNVRRFTPITTDLPAITDVDALRATAKTLATDVLNQFGVARYAVL